LKSGYENGHRTGLKSQNFAVGLPVHYHLAEVDWVNQHGGCTLDARVVEVKQVLSI
jgi:hypothetical protein